LNRFFGTFPDCNDGDIFNTMEENFHRWITVPGFVLYPCPDVSIPRIDPSSRTPRSIFPPAVLANATNSRDKEDDMDSLYSGMDPSPS